MTEGVLHGITSLTRAQAGARRLLTLQRGRRAVENANHYSRDVAFREDASRIRTGNGPLANVALNNLVLAIVRRRGKEFDTVPQARIHFSVRREDALAAILQPIRTADLTPLRAGRSAGAWNAGPAGPAARDRAEKGAGLRVLPGGPARGPKDGPLQRAVRILPHRIGRCASPSTHSSYTPPAWPRPTHEKESTLAAPAAAGLADPPRPCEGGVQPEIAVESRDTHPACGRSSSAKWAGRSRRGRSQRH